MLDFYSLSCAPWFMAIVKTTMYPKIIIIPVIATCAKSFLPLTYPPGAYHPPWLFRSNMTTQLLMLHLVLTYNDYLHEARLAAKRTVKSSVDLLLKPFTRVCTRMAQGPREG